MVEWGNIENGFYAGATVTGSAMQIAYYMGFHRVCLLGCDCDYGLDSSRFHFDGSLIDNPAGSTRTWGNIFLQYALHYEQFLANGREVVNCTVGGKLEVFPRVSLEDEINA
jgi:hypothetical protein